MRTTVATILVCVGATAVSAQILGAEPSCAITCLASAISVAGCAPNDQGCQCGTGQAAIQTAVTPCLLSACAVSDLQSAASVGLALCSVYSASIAGSMNATTTAASSAATMSSSMPMVTATMTSASGAMNGTMTMTGSHTGSGSATGVATGSSAASGTGRSSSATARTTSASTTAAGSTSSAAAGRVVVAGLGGMVGFLGAVVAAL